MSERISRIAEAVQKMHSCTSVRHVQSVPVNEVFQGQTVWQGVVEVFDITGHPKAERAYGWEIPGPTPDWVAVLEIPPVTSPATAVRAALVAQSKTK